jgi:hypothetical protein
VTDITVMVTVMVTVTDITVMVMEMVTVTEMAKVKDNGS